VDALPSKDDVGDGTMGTRFPAQGHDTRVSRHPVEVVADQRGNG
jgi:hypothetical protein